MAFLAAGSICFGCCERLGNASGSARALVFIENQMVVWDLERVMLV